MEYPANRGLETLTEFQKFLLDRKLVPEAKVSFFAYWVSRFLHYAQRHDVTTTEYQESAVAGFLDDLRSDKRILDWQPRQAEDALKLYYFHYLGKTKTQSGTARCFCLTPSIANTRTPPENGAGNMSFPRQRFQ